MRSQDIPASLAAGHDESQTLAQAGSSSTRVALLYRLMRSISIVWYAIIYVFLMAITLSDFMQRPSLLRELRGWCILALAVTLAFWYYVGGVWIAGGDRSGYYARIENGELPHLHWRGLLYWASVLGIVICLSLLENNFVWMFWAVYGLNFAIFPFPEVFATLIPTIVIIIVANGWLPSQALPATILSFVGELGSLIIYGIIACLPYMMIQARIRREKVFADLEESHRELELAHTRLEAAHRRLAEAGEREREIAVLRERGRLARDMHDTLGHALVLANVKLEAALRLRPVDAARADHEIVATQQILRDSMAELRVSLANLRSPLLAQESLGDALAQVARAAGARVTWDVYSDTAADISGLDEHTYEALLRVGSEAITNAERHARARSLWLYLGHQRTEAGKNFVVLRVSDDGIGIVSTCPTACGDPDPAPDMAHISLPAGVPYIFASNAGARAQLVETTDANTNPEVGHYGILGMRERVSALGGHLTLTSRDINGGTTVEARLPLANQVGKSLTPGGQA